MADHVTLMKDIQEKSTTVLVHLLAEQESAINLRRVDVPCGSPDALCIELCQAVDVTRRSMYEEWLNDMFLSMDYCIEGVCIDDAVKLQILVACVRAGRNPIWEGHADPKWKSSVLPVVHAIFEPHVQLGKPHAGVLRKTIEDYFSKYIAGTRGRGRWFPSFAPPSTDDAHAEMSDEARASELAKKKVIRRLLNMSSVKKINALLIYFLLSDPFNFVPICRKVEDDVDYLDQHIMEELDEAGVDLLSPAA